MKLLVWLVAVVTVVGAGAAGWRHYYGDPAGAGKYRTMKVRCGDITQVVNSTGTVQPVRSVQVGAFVSGPIQQVLVDFNAKVTQGQLLARIDPRTYLAAVAKADASLQQSRADLARVKVLLEQALRNEKRSLRLQSTKAIAETDVDKSVTERKSLEAQLALGEAAIRECDATLATAKTNLDFTEIKSPVDGIIIDRKVDPGQTVAATYQTPVMFVVAPDLEKKVYIYASVDEADIGMIRDAQTRGQTVLFGVDAYPKDVFKGKIVQVRLNPSTVQNVVTYTVVVESPNADLKLLPGMTANLSFQIETRTKTLMVPNAALRFTPKSDDVRPADRKIVEGASSDDPTGRAAGSESKAPSGPGANRQHVWFLEGPGLRAVEVVTGLSDKSTTELVSGELNEGQELVIGTHAVAVSKRKSFWFWK